MPVKTNIVVTEWEGIDHSDAPDYCDAYAVHAERDGIELTDEELDELTDISELQEVLEQPLFQVK